MDLRGVGIRGEYDQNILYEHFKELIKLIFKAGNKGKNKKSFYKCWFLYFCYGFKFMIFDESVVNFVLILANFLLCLSVDQFWAGTPALRFWGLFCVFFFFTSDATFLKLVFLLLNMFKLFSISWTNFNKSSVDFFLTSCY